MGIALEVPAVFEGAGLALVRIHGKQARARVGAHEAPFAAGRETGTAEPAQARRVDQLDDLLDVALATPARRKEPVAALAAVGLEIEVARHDGIELARRECRLDTRAARAVELAMPDRDGGCGVATAHAGCAHDPHLAAEALGELGEERLGAHERATQAVAYAHGERRRRRIALEHHIEVRVEGGDLVDLRLRQTHLLGECCKMGGTQAMIFVLNEMEVFDEEIALARPRAQQRPHLLERLGIELTALGEHLAAALPTAGVAEAANLRTAFGHRASVLP